MAALPLSEFFGHSSIVFRWATNSIYLVPRLALSSAPQGENT